MKIYEKEISAGLEEIIKSNASVAYSSPVSIYTPSKKQKENIQQFIVANDAIAENQDQFDLYYLNSVLVSTGWNKNDDVFDRGETWSARETPVDKQFNFMHDESDIIGHITNSLVMDESGNEVSNPDKTEKFDIVTSAVLYNSWSNPELKERMVKIISEIESNKWFVSMECLFNNFDYAVVTPQGEHKVIARDDASAFLTKHLRAYGGEGKYEGYTVGRLLRNIAFSGKGLVSNPANPRSVILNDVDPFKGAKAEEINNSSFKQENENMSDTLRQQVDELKAELVSAKTASDALKAEITKQKDQEFQSQIESFEASVSEKDTAITEVQVAVQAAETKVAELEETIAKRDEELVIANKKIEAHEAEAKTMARRAALVEAGFEEEDVEEVLASFAEATDEMFDKVVALKKKGSLPPWLDKDKKDDDDKDEKDDKKKGMKKKAEVQAEDATEEEADEADTEAEAEVLEDVEEEVEPALADAGDDSSDELRASASEWLETNVLRSTANINK
jgi:hypothetical protein|tara:strand:+ start:1294 stop:2814 length:1521 start_codon:yes stop_codon:yes gene_type:complete